MTDQAAKMVPQQCSSLRKGGYVVIKDRPCKIVDMSTSKTGKHGHAKVHLVALDMFTGKKCEDLCPSTHNMNVPVVKRTDLTMIALDEDGFITLMDDSGETRQDLNVKDNVHEDVKESLTTMFEEEGEAQVTVVSAMDFEQIQTVKTSK